MIPILHTLAIISSLTGVEASSPPEAPFFLPKLNWCRRRDRKNWLVTIGKDIDGQQSILRSPRALNVRAGGEGDGSNQPLKDSDATALTSEVPDEEEYEYEYEYEYCYEEDEGGEERNHNDDHPEEVEYANHGEMGEPAVEDSEFYHFYKSDQDRGAIQEESVNSGEASEDDIVTEMEEKRLPGRGGWSFWGWSKRDRSEEAGAHGDSKVTTGDKDTVENSASKINDEEKEDEGGQENVHVDEEEEEQEHAQVEVEEDDDEEEYLFTTPLHSFKENAVELTQNLQLANRTVPKEEIDTKENEIEFDDGAKDEEDKYYVELNQTPIVKSQINSKTTPRKAPKASKVSGSSWWQFQPQKSDNKPFRRRRPKSSSKTSFLSPLFYSGSSSSLSLHSSSGRPMFSEWGTLISSAVASIIQPIGNAIQTIAYSAASTLTRWISISVSLMRNTFDYLWYGPVDGVTTTGIATREGGLSAVLVSSPVMMATTSIVVLVLTARLVRKLWYETAIGDNGRGTKWRLDSSDDEEVTDEDVADHPPSIEEELEFLNRKFHPANPSSKVRITEAITKQNRFTWPSIRRGDDRPKSRSGQRQFTIKSIQKWWKERPSSQSIAIIEPEHVRNQQQPLGHEIKRLQKKLTVSEQERAILQQDVQRLQHKLQNAHQNTRSTVSKNKWLEKQTSQADQILMRAVEVERRKANTEVGRARESMREVLERERMLMRGRIVGLEQRECIGGQNDIDLIKGGQTRRLDGVKIVREVDMVDEKDDESERSWTAL